MIEISQETMKRIRALFSPEQWRFVEDYLLNECGDNLPNIAPSYHELAERIRFAVLKLSNGDMNKLKEWTADAAHDWRDTLMSAGFGTSLDAHLLWNP
jgi:hypothetical protein